MADRSFRGADGLRTLACLMVVFHHLSQELVIFRPSIQAPGFLRAIADFFASSGSAGVSVFFVLSGFLLALPFWKAYFDGSPMPSLSVFAVRRAGRIMPGFYLCLFFFAVAGLFFAPDAPALLWRYFAGLTFTSGFHWLTFFPVAGNGPLWSIGFEVVSYALLPLSLALLFLVGTSRRTLGLGLLWMAVVWAVVFGLNEWIQQAFVPEDAGRGWQYGLTGGAKFWMPRYNPIGFFGHFSLGITAAALAQWWSRQTWSQERQGLFDALSFLFFVAWLALLVSRTGQDQFSLNLQGQPYYYPLFPILSAGLLACLSQSGRMARVFDNRFSRYTAQISFGLYLWHTFVLSWFNGSINDTGEWLLLVALTVPLSYLIAGLSWKYFEKPILSRAQAWRPRARGEARRPLTRWGGLALGAAAVLILVPLALGTWLRPTAWIIAEVGELDHMFSQPGEVTGIAFDPSGVRFVAKNGDEVLAVSPDQTSRRVFRLTQPAPTVRLLVEPPKNEPLSAPVPSLFLMTGEASRLWNLKYGPDGLLYLAAGNRVLALGADAQVAQSWNLPFQPPYGVMDVAFDSNGDLFAGNGSQLFRIDRKRGEVSLFADLSAEGVRQIAGLQFSHDGSSLSLADFDNLHRGQSRVLTYGLARGKLEGPPRSWPAEGALFCTQDQSGNQYFTSSFTQTLYQLTADGRLRVLPYSNLGPLVGLAWSRDAEGLERLTTTGWDGTLGRIRIPQGGSL